MNDDCVVDIDESVNVAYGRTKTPTEVISGGMRMQFYVPTGETPLLDNQVDRTIVIKTDDMTMEGTLVKVSTAKLKNADKEYDIYNLVVVDVNKIITVDVDDNEFVVFELPDKKTPIEESFSITY